MRFSLVAATLMAVVAADQTVYKTEEVTITSCAPTVTDCPAQSTVVSVTSYPVQETYPADNYPVVSASPPVYANSSAPVYPTSTPAATYPVPEETYPAETAAPTAPGYSLSTVTISTCIPTVIESTYTVWPTTSAVSTGVIPVPTNGTVPSYTAPPPPTTNGASGLQASLGLAAVAAVAAFLF